MSLKLYYHPLASFCWKPLIALYENQTSFIPHLVDLADENSRGHFLKIWPMGEFPVLHDEERKQTIPQSTAIIEYLNLHYAGESAMIPAASDLALETRRWNEFYDSYLNSPMSKIVTDVLRPAGKNDSLGVADSRETIRTAYEILESRMSGRIWSIGDTFTMADCSAAPALFYANQVEPIGIAHKSMKAYLERLQQRPSFARVLKEAEPYFHMFPYKG